MADELTMAEAAQILLSSVQMVTADLEVIKLAEASLEISLVAEMMLEQGCYISSYLS